MQREAQIPGNQRCREMPPEAALIFMRAGAALWCNCGSSEGQWLRPAFAHHQTYQSPDVRPPFRFGHGNRRVFCRGEVRWESAINCVILRLFIPSESLTLLQQWCSPVFSPWTHITAGGAFHPQSKAVYNPHIHPCGQFPKAVLFQNITDVPF